MTKTARQAAIRELLGAQAISSQDELKRGLEARGFRVTQGTLSRDLKELGVNRAVRNGEHRYELPQESDAAALRALVGAGVTGLAANESLIVLHTLPGAAHSVGEFIDVQQNGDIIGTVAGDNTLLVIPAAARRTRAVTAWLREVLFGNA